jgi:hypothetical protein
MTRMTRYVLLAFVMLQLSGCTSSSASSVDASSSPCSLPGEVLSSQGLCVGVVGSYCGSGADCATLRCVQGVCAAAPVANGNPCGADTDCMSGTCDTATNKCGAQSNSTDCLRDVECTSGVCACGTADTACSQYGGSTCGPRPNGDRCGRDEDCTSGTCDVPERRCGPQNSGSTCARTEDCQSKNCDTAANAGAGACGPVANGTACTRDEDCSSTICSMGKCAAPTGHACPTPDAGCDAGVTDAGHPGSQDGAADSGMAVDAENDAVLPPNDAMGSGDATAKDAATGG